MVKKRGLGKSLDALLAYTGTERETVVSQDVVDNDNQEKLASLPTSSVAKGTATDVKGEFHFATDGLDPAKPTTFTPCSMRSSATL